MGVVEPLIFAFLYGGADFYSFAPAFFNNWIISLFPSPIMLF